MARVGVQEGHVIQVCFGGLSRVRPHEAKSSPFHVGCQSINDIKSEVIESVDILCSQHSPGSKSIQDLRLVRCETLLNPLNVFEGLGLITSVVYSKALEFLNKSLLLLWRELNHGAEAELDRLGDLCLGECRIGAGIDGALDDCGD